MTMLLLVIELMYYVKIILGLALGIACWVGGIGGAANLIAGPVLVLMLSFFAKIFG